MMNLQLLTGSVRQLTRSATRWRGGAEPPDTRFWVGDTALVFPRTVSLGEGDLVTVVGSRRRRGLRVEALRNDSTDVAYPAATATRAILALVLLGAAALPLGPWRWPVLAAAGWLAWRASLAHLANTVLRATPSRHGLPTP